MIRHFSAIALLAFPFCDKSSAQTPDLIWGRNFGGIDGAGVARITEACITPDGGVVNGGWFTGTVDLDNEPAIEQLFTLSGEENGFVTRLDATGLMQWAVQFSGSAENRVLDVATNSQGEVFALLKFEGTVDLDPGPLSVMLSAVGNSEQARDLVLVKLDAQGQYLSHLVSSFASYDMGEAQVEVDSQGRVVLAFNWDAQMIKSFTLSGSDLSSISSFTFGNYDFGNARLTEMQLDDQDNQLFAGWYTLQISLDPQDNSIVSPGIGAEHDLFYSKVSSSGVLVFGHVLGANGSIDEAFSICGADDVVLVTGHFEGTVDMDAGPGTTNLVSDGGHDLFLLKLSQSGAFQWVKRIGTASEDGGYAVRVNSLGDIVLTGYLGASGDVDPGPGTTTLTISAQSSMALQFDAQGELLWARALAFGSWVNNPVDLDLFTSDALALSGSFSGAAIDRDPSPLVDYLFSADGAIAFNLKWGDCSPVTPTITISADIDPVCPNLPVGFTAVTTNGGIAPQYQWLLNGAPVGGNSSTYNVFSLDLGDVVTCTLTSNAECAVPSVVQSNAISVDCNVAPGVLFFSEYIEGTASNKALEIFNPTPNSVDLAAYTVALYINGSSTPSQTLQLSGSLPAYEVYVIANSNADPLILAQADALSAVCNYNGDDAVALLHFGMASDVIGEIGVDPGTNWPIPSGGATSEYTLRRNEDVVAPESDWVIAQFQWNTFAQDDFTDLGDGLTTGLAQQVIEEPMLHPNPARTGFRIASSAPVAVRIIAPSGALVMEIGSVATGAFISTDHMDSGVYIVELLNVDGTRRERLVVE